MSNIEKYSQKTFDDIRHFTEEGIEFWYGRELQVVLEYAEWRNFYKVINKAKMACEKSKQPVSDHFVDINKMIDLAKGAQREIDDILLTRYACYLIVQNSDPRKEVVALGQTYFAVKTRERELEEGFDELTEEGKRLAIRTELRNHNKSLAEAAQMAGVETPKDYAIFQNKGYQGLYGGLGAREIHRKKGLKKKQKILDHMGSTELAANLFRATQTDEKLRRDNIKGKEKANLTHFKVGAKVRKTIKELGGTMPEDLPAPEKSLKEIEKEQMKKELSSD
jgi:DNA-damage-inducible protein D